MDLNIILRRKKDFLPAFYDVRLTIFRGVIVRASSDSLQHRIIMIMYRAGTQTVKETNDVNHQNARRIQ